MAKCENCGKSFDYEKYYGICPKCSAYNRVNNRNEAPSAQSDQVWQDTSGQGTQGCQSAPNQGEQSTQNWQSTPNQGEQSTQNWQSAPNQGTQEQRDGQNQEMQQGQESQDFGMREWQEAQSQEWQSQGNQQGHGTQQGQEARNRDNQEWQSSQGRNEQNWQNGQNAQSAQGRSERMIEMPYVPPAGSGNGIYAFDNASTMRAKKNSPGAIALFVCLLVGIFLTIAVPISYLIVRSLQLGAQSALQESSYLEDDYWTDGPAIEQEPPLTEKIPQDAEIVAGEAGSDIQLGNEKSVTVKVGESYILVPPGLVEGFPKGEKLVAIPVEYINSEEHYHNYDPVNIIYVGYGDRIYKETMDSYSMEEFTSVLGEQVVLDAYDFSNGEGSGVILAFVPQEVEEFQLYLESRDQDTNELLEIYQIPLQLKTGEGA